jgi:uncharacterized membrane protein
VSSEVEIRLTAIDDATDVINKVAGNVQAASGQINASVEQTVAATKESTASTKETAVAFNNLATAGFSLYNSFDRIHESEVALDRANLMVAKSTETVERAQTAYDQAVEKYGPDSQQAKDAADKLTIATDAHTVACERQGLAQDNVNKSMAMAAMSVVPSIITVVTSFTSVAGGMSGAIEGISAALDFLSANPIVLVIAGIAALVVGLIYAYNNCAPLRDGLNTIAAVLGGALSVAANAIIAALTWFWQNVLVPLATFLQNTFVATINIVGGALNWLGGVLGPVISAISSAVNAIGGAFSWLGGAIGGVCGDIAHSFDVLEGRTTSFTVVIMEKIKQMHDQSTAELAKQAADNLAVVSKGLDDQAAKLKASYDAQEAAIDKSLQSTLTAIKKYYDDETAAANTQYDKDYAAFIAYWNQKYTTTETALDKLINKVSTYYDQQLSAMQSAYSQQMSETNKFYDDQVNAANAEVERIRQARQGELDNLELNMLEQKEALKTAHEAGVLSDKDYQQQLSDLQKKYNSDRSDANDSYRLKELEAEKTAKTNIIAINQERSDKLGDIVAKEAEMAQNVEASKNDAIKTIQDQATALSTKHQDDLKKIEEDAANARLTAQKNAEEAKKAALEDYQSKSKAVVEKGEADKQNAIAKANDATLSNTKSTFDNLVTVVGNGLGIAWNTISSWCTSVGSAIVGAVSGAVSSASSALQSFASSAASALGAAGSAVANFISSICFAHAIGNAVESSRKDLGDWVQIVGTSMDKAKEHMQGFIANMKDVGLDVNAKVPEPVGMGTMIVPATVSRPNITVTITAPLVQIQGSADRATAELAAKMVNDQLQNVIVEATSGSAPATQKRIRQGAVFT